MKHSRPRLAASSSSVPGRDVSRHNIAKTLDSQRAAIHSGESIGHSYLALPESSSGTILLLSPESIVLGWSLTTETVSGWVTDKALGGHFHFAGTSGVGTMAIASVPAAEGFVP
jgi:hypothetical protein